MRLYLVFLIGEALRSWDFRQVLRLFSRWVPGHPLDSVILPLSVFWSKAVLHLQRIDKAFPGYVFATGKVPFPIGELDLSTGTSIAENGGVYKKPLKATGSLRGWIKPKI
jgi:hypothetical protein